MKKRFYLPLLLSLSLLLSGCAYFAYVPEPPKTTEVGIKEAFLLQYVSAESSYTEKDLSVQYVGQFDGFDAVYVHGVLNYTQAEDSETVGVVTFRYASGQHLLVYSHEDNRLYTLQQALEGGVLNEKKLRQVYEAHRAAEPFLYKETEPEEPSMEETSTEVSVTEVTDEDILRAFAEKNPSLMEETTMERLSVVRIGVYDGCHAVWVMGPFLELNMIYTDTVDGLDFVYGSTATIDLYRDGVLYKLPEAWEAGLLSRPALKELHEALTENGDLIVTPLVDRIPTDEEILSAFMDKNYLLMGNLTMEDLSVVRIGEFGGCYAVWVNGPFAYNTAITTQIVDGLKFVYSSSHTMDIYRDGVLYKLPEAWEAGVISREALKELHEAFGGSGEETE